MGKLFFSFLLILVACSVDKQKLDGAYEIILKHKDSAVLPKARTVALFKNGYWITTSFTQASIIKCSGGIYNIKNEDYIQTVNFNSVDTSKVGKKYSRRYTSDEYLIASFASINLNKKNTDENAFRKISTSESLKNASLEGVWKMKHGQGGYIHNNEEIIRIFAYPYFAMTIYSVKEKRFYDAYGGTYEFDGKELIEKVEYSNYQIPPGGTIEWSVKKLTTNEIQLFDVDSFNDEEIFDQISNQ